MLGSMVIMVIRDVRKHGYHGYTILGSVVTMIICYVRKCLNTCKWLIIKLTCHS